MIDNRAKVFRYKSIALPRILGLSILLAFPFGGVAAILIASLGSINPTWRYQGNPFSALIFSCCYTVALVGLFIRMLFTRNTPSRLEIQGEVLHEYDLKGRLVARGNLNDIKSIEKFSLNHGEGFFIHFSDGPFVMFSSGLRGFDELTQLVLSRYQSETTERSFQDMAAFNHLVYGRQPIV